VVQQGVRVGFACHWDADERATWSQTPWFLRAALRERAGDAIVDLRPGLRQWEIPAAKAISARRGPNGWSAPWKQHPLVQRAVAHRLVRAADDAAVDAVVQIHDLGATHQPFFMVQDLSYDIVLESIDRGDRTFRQFSLSRSRYAALRARQHDIIDRCAGVFAMSNWLARHLVEHSGMRADQVHVIRPGANLPPTATAPPDRSAADRPRGRLLFVGRDFDRKGGDVVVAAAQILRRQGRAVTLTVAGPDRWPLDGEPPDGVSFLGPVPPEQLVELYDHHDLFVLPSRFEAFGIVFVEALSRHLPCIAADRMAMPEIVQHGRTGLLVPADRSDDPETLAELIDRALGDDSLYAEVAASAGELVASFSWERSADTILAAVQRTVAGASGQP
jgi:glycosyltransferase involved in cell wall biosynthesis